MNAFMQGLTFHEMYDIMLADVVVSWIAECADSGSGRLWKESLGQLGCCWIRDIEGQFDVQHRLSVA
jgi:hypothetical protein